MSLPISSAEPPVIAPVDLERFRLRAFLDSLAASGDMEIHREPVALSRVAGILDGNRRAVLFEQAGGQPMPLVGNVMGARDRMARAFAVEPHALAPEILRRLRNEPRLVRLDSREAPVHQVIRTGDEVDLTELPVHLQHGLDGAPYISAALDFSLDQATGFTNVGVRRLMLRARRETGVDLMAPSDLRAIYLASHARGERLPISFVVGAHPIDYMAGTMRIPGDELGLLSSLRGSPLPVVKCLTNDLLVPADAEMVIEGYLDPAGYTEPEGPYGEFLGYYGEVKLNPVFRVTALTHRRDAVFQTITIGGRALGHTDTGTLCAVSTEIRVSRALENAVREVTGIYVPPASGIFNVRIALRQRAPGEARNAIAAVFASFANVKNVFVVDPDIDVFSDEQMEWALATRFQPDRDLVVQGGFRTLPLDPSLDGSPVGAKAGYDLTSRFGAAVGLGAIVPEPPTYRGERFATVREALAGGPKTFEDLMAATGSEDGREIVLALHALREAGLLGRELERGRYELRT